MTKKTPRSRRRDVGGRRGPVARLLEFCVATYDARHPDAPLGAAHLAVGGEALILASTALFALRHWLRTWPDASRARTAFVTTWIGFYVVCVLHASRSAWSSHARPWRSKFALSSKYGLDNGT